MCPVNVPQQKPNTYPPKKKRTRGHHAKRVFGATSTHAHMPNDAQKLSNKNKVNQHKHSNRHFTNFTISQMQNQTLAWPSICVWRQTSEFIVLVGFPQVKNASICCWWWWWLLLSLCVCVHLPTQLYATTKN